MNFCKSASSLIISFLLSIIFSSLAIAEKPAEHAINFDKVKNTLSVRLNDAKLADIAEALSEKTGIKVFLDKSVTRTVTSAFQNELLESGIKQLLGPDINSAFIFVKETPPSGEVIYRLDTVKIFNKGNLLSGDFDRFEKNIQGKKRAKPSNPASSKPHRPTTPGAIAHEIMKARKNLDLLHMKNKVETERVQRKIIGLNMKLSQNPSPEERATLVRELNQARQSLGMVKSLNSQLIMGEEQNIRDLIEEKTKIENRGKFMERDRDSSM